MNYDYNYRYKLSLYSNFNNELMSGINQGLSLYSPQEDLKLYKTIDTKPLDEVNKKIEGANLGGQKNNFNLKGLLDSLLIPSPIIGGDIGTDIVNYYNYKVGNDSEFKSKTIEFYNEPLKEIYNNYSTELYTILGFVFVGLIIYKKI